ncbi:hypothetical protein [Absidia glauca]|uniref:Uncharacterized protein n=1 Tax=Absidia glauca TaxID=4829 RepID=A0A168NHL3_ABSGL|nr:hypothetical protein [Absidia glauca]
MSSFTVAQRLALKLYALKAKCQLTNRQYKMVTDLVEDVVNEYAPGFKCLSQYQSQRLVESIYPVKPTAHDMCPKGCFLFGDQTICPSCGGRRYKTNGTPARQMKVLPIGRYIQWR